MMCFSRVPFRVISLVNKNSLCDISTMFSSQDSVLVVGKIDKTSDDDSSACVAVANLQFQVSTVLTTRVLSPILRIFLL